MNAELVPSASSEDLLWRVLEAMPAGMLVVDPVGKLVMINSHIETLFGYDRNELLGQSVEVLLPERFRAAHAQLRADYNGDPQARKMGMGRDLYGLRKDGSEFPAEIGLNPVKTDEGLFVLAVLVDITERKRREDAYRGSQRRAALNLAQDAEDARKRAEQSEERLNLALKSSGVGTWNWNIVDNAITWDDFIHPLFGLKPGTFPGTHEAFVALIHPDDQQGVHSEVTRAVEQDAEYDTEFRVVWPDHSIHVVGARGKVYRDAAGKPLRMTGVCWDLTQRRLAEEELKRTTAELLRSNQELEQFAYIASHDLQEPLRKVQSFGDLLAAKMGAALGEEESDYLKRMQGAAQRMQGLINDLLAFARVTSQARPFVPVNLNQLAREVLSDLEARLKTSGGRVEIGDLPQLESDPLQIRQLLQNLIGNALKFHHPDVPPVVALNGRFVENTNVANMDHSAAARLCEITVKDNGIGFDEKYLDRIFAPFQRLHGQGAYPGTGMGLAICRKIVQRHGGAITARSSPGQGAMFVVTLPARQSNGGPPNV